MASSNGMMERYATLVTLHVMRYVDGGLLNHQCITVEVGCNCSWWDSLFLNCPGPDLHYYAEDDFGTWWGGNQTWLTCTEWHAFDICDYAGSCPNDPLVPTGRLLRWGVWLHDYQQCNLTLNFN
jgi:hypothetical protein